MALDLRTTYGIQVLSGVAGYPYGKARNVTVPGDGTGTPWEQQIVNDWIGFHQALLSAASITPSGSPDSALASDYLDAVKYLIRNVVGDVGIQGNVHIIGGPTIGLTADGFIQVGGSVLSTSGFVSIVPNTFWLSSTFKATSSFEAQLSVTPGGIVIGPGGVVIGNGLDGLIIQVGGLVVLSGIFDITPAADFASTVTVHDELILADSGRIRDKVAYAPDANHTFAIGDGTIYVARQSVVTTSRTWTLPLGNEGNRLTLINYTAFAMTLHNASGGSILTVPSSTLPAAVGGIPSVVKLIWLDNGTYTGWSGA